MNTTTIILEKLLLDVCESKAQTDIKSLQINVDLAGRRRKNHRVSRQKLQTINEGETISFNEKLELGIRRDDTRLSSH